MKGSEHMPKGSDELTQSRKDEIVSACEELYKTMSFKDITVKEIGCVTSFTRTSIYNYFSTKEEIFLALLQREYTLWIEQLKKLRADNIEMSRAEFASALAHSLEERENLLFTSGQIAINPATGNVDAQGIEAQTRQICENLKAVLAEAGCTLDNVIKTTCFLADMGDFAAFNEVYAKYFTSKPARSCVAVKSLPKGVLCEIEAIAEK